MSELIKKIDDLILSSKKYEDNSPLLERLSLLIQEYFEEKYVGKHRDFLFDEKNSNEIKRFISVCFIRLMGVSNDTHLNNEMLHIAKVVQNSIHDFCASLNVNAKTKTYEFEKIIIDFINRKEKEFFENLTFDGEITQINNFQQSYRRGINHILCKTILFPFLNEIISKVKLDKTFLKISEFIDAGAEHKYRTFQKAKENLEDLITEASNVNTYYSINFVKAPFQNILTALTRDFEQSPFNIPSNLSLQKTEKKFPFHEGSKSSISFIIVKDVNTGYAFNTNVKILDFSSQDIRFNRTEQFIGDIKSSQTIVDFDYEIIGSSKSFLIEIEVSWNSVDGSKSYLVELLDLPGQEENIDWKLIMGLEPYNLEPVESEKELIGRDNILSRLKTMTSSSVGSSYIYGQRRVGKTSIVKTLLNSNPVDNLLIIYIEAGDWNDAQNPFKSMENLARRICKKIQTFKPKFNSLQIPDFKDSFNNITEFLDQVIEVDSDFKSLIILDEFDRISRELFERGDIGKSFLLTIRSISNRSQFGFILVGGEKLEFILSQWQEFNKFKPVRVDYFSKDEDWKDFTQLIKKPVEGIIEISDNAIEVIYNKTSGNPYFTKKICIEMYNLMVTNRDVHVTQKEAENATIVARSTQNIGATDFSHFWEDGIKGRVEREEETSLKRRKILIVIANLLKNDKKTTKSNIIDYGTDYGLGNDEVDKYLVEFEQRKIIITEGGEYKFFVNFFEEWLLSGGVDKIISSFEEEERLSLNKKHEEEATIKFNEIISITKNWKTFKGNEITSNHVREWLDQFDDVFDQRLIFKVLVNLKFYSELEIREKLEDLFVLVKKQIMSSGRSKLLIEGKRKREDILVTYFDDNPSKGGSYYTKLFVESNNIYKDNSCVPNVIEKRVNEIRNLNAVVVIDDFLGSGNSMIENITKYQNELTYITNTKELVLVFGLITGFTEAKDKVEKHLFKLKIPGVVLIIDPLDDNDKCFSNSSKFFSTSIDRKRAEDICARVGGKLEKKHPLGFYNCQSAIVFPINCPNNSLPIFWKKNETWTPLFERN
jgi:hypothetical protein